jgi:hypothetical protein
MPPLAGEGNKNRDIKTAVQLLPAKVPDEAIRQVAKAILKVKGAVKGAVRTKGW